MGSVGGSNSDIKVPSSARLGNCSGDRDRCEHIGANSRLCEELRGLGSLVVLVKLVVLVELRVGILDGGNRELQLEFVDDFLLGDGATVLASPAFSIFRRRRRYRK